MGSSSASLEGLLRFRAKKYHKAALPMRRAAMMQPTTIPAIAPLLIVDELELLLLPVAVGVLELVETVLLLDIKVVVAVDDVDVTELVE